jgi:putative ABC transport system permease protein
MFMFTQQIGAITLMNLKTIASRFWETIVIVISIAVVVAVLQVFLAMNSGFSATVESSGSEDLAIILRNGSQSELNSSFTPEVVNILKNAPGIARAQGLPEISSELYVIVNGTKRAGGNKVNLPLRGIDIEGVALRDNLGLIEGRMFTPGKNEIVVGQAAVKQFSGLDLNSEIKLGRNLWKVVGIFGGKGSVFDSELWADAKTVQSQFNRAGSVQLLRVRLDVPGDVSAIEGFIAADDRLNAEVFTEAEYFKLQASGTADFLFYLGWPLAIIMALGTLAGSLNAMYSAVSQRTGDIATLRAIGFNGWAIFWATMVESVLYAIVGGIAGIVIAYYMVDGIVASTLGGRNFTQIVFDFTLSPTVILNGVGLAIAIGVLGGLLPAFRAARLPITKAFNLNL